MLKINMGSGAVLLEGWLNIDLSQKADLIFDLSRGLPEMFPDLIYSEHFIEHLTYGHARNLLTDCFQKMKHGAVIRIATPDLDYSMKKYFTDWHNQDWLQHPDYSFLNTKGKVINQAFRGWGHQYFYNEEDLTGMLKACGFENIKRVENGKSEHPELCKLETRTDSNLIMEATK